MKNFYQIFYIILFYEGEEGYMLYVERYNKEEEKFY